MKVLVLTIAPWDDTNSIGNTMTNWLSAWDSKDLANIYCRASKPNNDVCQLYYSISDLDLLNSIFKPNHKPGHVFKWNKYIKNTKMENKNIINENQLYDIFRGNKFIFTYWAQDLLWEIGKWKNNTLNQFLDEFKPDLIFAACGAASYHYKLLWYLQKVTQAKVVLFHGDDYLTINGLGGSPLSRIDRWLRARRIAESAKKADLNYCSSQKQQEEYSHKLQKKINVLYKGANFDNQLIYKTIIDCNPIKIIYMGSTQCGRWRTIGMLARAIQKINDEKPKFELLIYSQYQPSHKARQAMVIDGASRFMGKIPAAEVSQTLKDSDIVLHVESFAKKERLATRLSFSTKIVDYLHSGRCIMAIGWKEAASIDYLIKNDAALVATDQVSVYNQLKRIVNNAQVITEYANKAWECGKRNHQLDLIQNKLYAELNSLVLGQQDENITY